MDVSAHGAEDPKDLKGGRRLQREDSELSEKEGKESSFPGASQSLGPWNVGMPLNSFGPYHRIPGRG